MKHVLFVTYDFPYPTNTGGKNRAFNMLKHSRGNFRKFLFSFIRDDFNQEYVKEIARCEVETVALVPRQKVKNIRNLKSVFSGSSIFRALYYSKKTREKLISIVKKYDINIVHFESYFTGFYISQELKDLGVKQVYGSENIEHKLYQDIVPTAPFFLRPLFKRQVRQIHEEEKNMFRKSDISIAVSEADAVEARKYNKCEIVRNGVDLDVIKYTSPKKEASRLLYVGNFTYHPNVDAVDFFLKEVFNNLTGFSLKIVGKGVDNIRISDTGIETIEFIPEIMDAYRSADIVVAPVRLGGGTNFKILEAMAAGIPVVSLPHRLEGLKVTDKRNIMIARSAPDFEKKIEELAGSYALRKRISENARALVENEYTWEVAGKHLSKVWENL